MGINKIGSLFADAGNAAKNVFDKAKEKTILVVDQNDNGKFDIGDVSAMADAVGSALKKGATTVKESAKERRRKMDLKTLRPIFPYTLDQAEFMMSKFIRVTDRDKKYAENDVCQGSIGFLADKSGLRIVNLFKDSLDAFGLSFYPDIDCEFYYVNPADRNNYISLDGYFSYLKTVRINELQRVAQALGATHFKVTYKEEHTSSYKVKGKAQVAAVERMHDTSEEYSLERAHDTSEKKYSMINVAAEMFMDGHAPQMPELVYLSKNDNVQNLIHLRMTGGEGFHHHKISINMGNSSGIKESEAVKIDAVLSVMNVSSNISVAREARSESCKYLEYEIDF